MNNADKHNIVQRDKNNIIQIPAFYLLECSDNDFINIWGNKKFYNCNCTIKEFDKIQDRLKKLINNNK